MKPTVNVRRQNAGAAKRAVEAIARQMREAPRSVQVGLPAGEVGSDILSIGLWLEFGTTTIPERPFLRNSMRAGRDGYANVLRGIAERVVSDAVAGGPGLTVKQGLGQLGAKAQGDIQKEIVALDSPPNAPSTVRQKGSSNPLIDTGRLRQAITWKYGDS